MKIKIKTVIAIMIIGLSFIFFIPRGHSLNETHYLYPGEKVTYEYTIIKGDVIKWSFRTYNDLFYVSVQGQNAPLNEGWNKTAGEGEIVVRWTFEDKPEIFDFEFRNMEDAIYHDGDSGYIDIHIDHIRAISGISGFNVIIIFSIIGICSIILVITVNRINKNKKSKLV